MTIGTPYTIGTATTSGHSSMTITPGQATAAGDTLIVFTDSDEEFLSVVPSACTDTGGNTYTALPIPQFFGNPYMACWIAPGTTPLTTSSTITINWSGNSDLNATAVGCPGLAQGNAADQVVWDYIKAGTISLTTGPLGLDSELGIAYWVSRQAQGAPAITPDWASFAAFQGAANTHYTETAWKLLTSAAPVTVSATTPSAGTGWAGLLVTLRGQIHPAATLRCGGTMTGYPVTSVPRTAALHCGGTLLTGGQLDPVAPPQEPVFPAGYGPVTADFEQWIRQSLSYCTNQTVFRAEQAAGGGQALTANVWNPLAYDTILEDPFGGWSATTTSSQAAYSWLAPWTGWYRVTFRWCAVAGPAWQNAAAGVSGVNPTYEAGGGQSPSGVTGGAGASFLVPLIGGQDYIQLLANPSASATTDTTTAGRRPSVEITSVQTDLQGS